MTPDLQMNTGCRFVPSPFLVVTRNNDLLTPHAAGFCSVRVLLGSPITLITGVTLIHLQACAMSGVYGTIMLDCAGAATVPCCSGNCRNKNSTKAFDFGRPEVRVSPIRSKKTNARRTSASRNLV